MQRKSKKIKLAIIFAALLAILAIGYGIYTQTTRSGKIAVTVISTPRDADITINGEKASPGTIYLKPDQSYTVTVRKDGFEEVTRKQYISSSNAYITQNLVPVSDEAKKWTEKHAEEYQEVEALGGEEATQKGLALRDKNPIINVLPYDENLLYTIGYYADTNDPSGNSIVISIEASEGARNAAIQQIYDLGYNPTDYKIEFSDYRNPFAL